MNPIEFSRRDFLKAVGLGTATIMMPGCASAARTALPKDENQKPNIVFILADDLGWAEPGCYGNDFNETPHLDRLAAEGMRFTDAYAAAPVCSPYRAALLTGQYPVRVGIVDYLRPKDKALSTDYLTIAKILKRNGYATGMIGKWHLTGYRYHGADIEIRAKEHGFDEELVSEIKAVGNGANFYPYKFRKQPVTWLNVRDKKLPGNEYLVDRMNLEAIEFIERHHKQPFFLYLSHYATHTILRGKEQLVAKYRKKRTPGKSSRSKCYICQDAGKEGDPENHWAKDHNPHLAAMLESIDDGIGMIMKKLDELGLADNTIVVFTSDNGGETNVTSNAPLRGGKSQLYEGGIRVPLIVRWPGKVTPSTVCRQPTSNVDFCPTFLDAIGIKKVPKQPLDGVSILPLLTDPDARLERDALYWHYPLDKPHFLGGRSSGAIRQGNFKLIEFYDTGEVELYNIGEDVSEKNNLADKHIEKVTELRRLLARWRNEVGADAKGPNKRPINTTPVAAEAAILNFIGQDSSTSKFP